MTEIIVTAEHRTSSVQRTAASISVRSGDDLREQGKTRLGDIIENIPGITGGASTANTTNPGGGTDTAGAGVTIRGISSSLGAGGNNASTAAAVAVYVDDVYEGVGGGYDLDRVEVLRGPQGTLYGRSATGGVVAIHTRDPDLGQIDGFALAEAGSYGLRHATAAINVPVVTDKLAIRVAGDYYKRNGFDTANGLGYIENKNLRIKVLAKPTENLTILLGGAIQYNNDATGGKVPYYDSDGKRYFEEVPLGSGKNHSHQIWAKIEWDLGPAKLTYIPAYRSWYQDALNVGTGPGVTVNNALTTPKDHFFTNEVRLASNGSSRLTWQVGALNFYNTLASTNSIRFALPDDPLAFAADISKRTRAFGVFGEATYALTDSWRVTGGLRYDHTAVDIAETYTAASGETFTLPTDQGRLRFNDWTYKLRTEYELSPSNLIYASYSTGFSPGDASVTTDTSGRPIVVTLKDEMLRALEFGSKNRFFGNTLQANAALYLYHYTGYQNAGIDIDPGPGLAFETLVAPMRTFGGELELVYQPDRSNRLSLNLAYANAQFHDRSPTFQSYIARRRVFGIAPFTADASYSHRFELAGGSALTLRVDGRYMSPHDAYAITQEQLELGGLGLDRVPSVGIADLNVTWTSANKRLSVSAYLRNITDNRYVLKSQIDVESAMAADGTISRYINNSALNIYQPRTIGAVVSVNF